MRETRGAIAYRKRLERKLEPAREKPKQRQWWVEGVVTVALNLSVWITGSGIIGQMLDNKNATSVLWLGISGIILTILSLLIAERKSKCQAQ